MFAFTFDDGPHPRWTPAVLAALADARARATFFVLGSRAREHPELVRRALAEGHGVELHGHEHLRHPASGREAVAADLDAGLQALCELGAEPRLWRVPWGDLTALDHALATGGSLLAVRWRHPTETYPLRGDEVHARLAERFGAPALSAPTDDYALDRFDRLA